MWVRFPLAWILYICDSKLKSLKESFIKKNQIKTYKQVNYTFSSLFSPSSVKNLSLYLNNLVTDNDSPNSTANYRSKRIMVKQSYLILAWLNIASSKKGSSGSRCSFSFLPKKYYRFTNNKAPMAHKTFSQEQFSIQYRRLAIQLPLGSSEPLPILNTLLSITVLHNNRLSVGTNLLFLSKVVIVLPTKDSSFFKIK